MKVLLIGFAEALALDQEVLAPVARGLGWTPYRQRRM